MFRRMASRIDPTVVPLGHVEGAFRDHNVVDHREPQGRGPDADLLADAEGGIKITACDLIRGV